MDVNFGGTLFNPVRSVRAALCEMGLCVSEEQGWRVRGGWARGQGYVAGGWLFGFHLTLNVAVFEHILHPTHRASVFWVLYVCPS